MKLKVKVTPGSGGDSFIIEPTFLCLFSNGEVERAVTATDKYTDDVDIMELIIEDYKGEE